MASPSGMSRVVLEKVVFQRDQARGERDHYLALITKLVELDEAPRFVHYRSAWRSAVEDARGAIRSAR